MPLPDTALSILLIEAGLVSQENLKKAEEQSHQNKSSLYDSLLNLDLISDENIGKLVADNLSTSYIELSKVSIPDEILKIIPEVVARKNKIVCFGKDTEGLKVAMNDPLNTEVVSLLQKKNGEKVKVFFATDRDLETTFNLYRNELQQTFDEMLKDTMADAKQKENKEKAEVSVAKIVDLLIEYAYQNKASDIHIEPEEEISLIRFRIDGILHDVLRVPKNLHEQIVSRVKVLSRLRIDEHLSSQDSKMQMKISDENLDVRVSVVPIVNGEKVVLRLLSSRTRQFSLQDLGFCEADFQKVSAAFSSSYGMILATGPTGSGKTTTIYAILKILNVREKNIATIEDPVEYEIQGINQIQVNPKTNLTFANGLRSILRQDPDIMFVGEIRDDETADIAVNSALTGHLVLSTLHTNDSATTLPRLMDMKIEPFLIASTVNVVIAQRLVRKICETCRFSQNLTSLELEKNIPKELVSKYFGDTQEMRIYKGKGCAVCHQSGYVGRLGIFEVLKIDDPIRKLIVEKADSGVIKNLAIKNGMTTMFEDGLRKIKNGVTTIEEVLRVTKE